jgi:hypothetical protein
MPNFFVIFLLFILVIFYLTGFMKIDKNENFSLNPYSNIYEPIDIVPSKMLFLRPPNPLQPDVDYQDNLNEVSGYDSGTRGYNNPYFAAKIAADLDTN